MLNLHPKKKHNFLWGNRVMIPPPVHWIIDVLGMVIGKNKKLVNSCQNGSKYDFSIFYQGTLSEWFWQPNAANIARDQLQDYLLVMQRVAIECGTLNLLIYLSNIVIFHSYGSLWPFTIWFTYFSESKIVLFSIAMFNGRDSGI